MNKQRKWHSAAAVLAGLLVSTATASAGPVRFSGEGHAETPVWSLDGKYLAFEVNRLAGDIEMFISEVSGDVAGEARALKLPGAGSSPYGSSGSVATNATFHPDGIVLFDADRILAVERGYDDGDAGVGHKGLSAEISPDQDHTRSAKTSRNPRAGGAARGPETWL